VVVPTSRQLSPRCIVEYPQYTWGSVSLLHPSTVAKSPINNPTTIHQAVYIGVFPFNPRTRSERGLSTRTLLAGEKSSATTFVSRGAEIDEVDTGESVRRVVGAMLSSTGLYGLALSAGGVFRAAASSRDGPPSRELLTRAPIEASGQPGDWFRPMNRPGGDRRGPVRSPLPVGLAVSVVCPQRPLDMGVQSCALTKHHNDVSRHRAVPDSG
jgi:hypothetical protein